LTKDAKDFCHELNWPVQKSEWERLARLQPGGDMQEKKVAMMLTALHARLRGYRVKVLPEINGVVPSDLLLMDANKKEYYTFVLLGDSISQEVIDKMKKVQGRVGVCALDPQNREKLKAICKKQGIIQGAEADLRLLIAGNKEDQNPISIIEINKDTRMWQEEW
jgi:hypothetical protein